MNKPVWDPKSPRKSALAGQVVAENFAGWSAEIRQEFADNSHNHQVGSVLLSETDEVKVWSIRLAPGERVPAHRHVLNYFWTALTDGISLQHTDDGTTRRVVYRAGDTRHFSFPGDRVHPPRPVQRRPRRTGLPHRRAQERTLTEIVRLLIASTTPTSTSNRVP